MTIDATFWVMISFFLFVGLLIYFQIPQKIRTTLDENILNIKNQINEADKLKEDAKNILPEVKIGEDVNILKLNDEQHYTDPPPRFSEASLVKKMEELGIGRPSTYSSIITVLQDRQYVKLDKKRFIKIIKNH